MTHDKSDKRGVLVTGSANGIGAAVCAAFREEDAFVVGLDLTDSESADVSVIGDVTETQAHERAIEALVDRVGQLDVLVPNAGIHDGGPRLLELDAGQHAAVTRRVLDVDVVGSLLALRAGAPYLMSSKGCVVTTLSDASFFVGENHAGIAYTAAKYAALGMLRWAAHELAPEVRVNGVAPGGVVTGLRAVRPTGDIAEVFDAPAAAEDGISKLNPLGTVQNAGDIAALYTFLASSAARGMTGEVLRPDGGLGVR